MQDKPINKSMQTLGRLGGRPRKDGTKRRMITGNPFSEAHKSAVAGLGVRRVTDPVSNPQLIKSGKHELY